jgi:glucose-1-phosphate thymidylyltransferase
MDMVGLDGEGQICEIKIKPTSTNFNYTWIIAVWIPTFTQFMREYVSVSQRENHAFDRSREVFFSDVINAAIKSDLQVDKVIFNDGKFLDIGIPEHLVKTGQFTIGTS